MIDNNGSAAAAFHSHVFLGKGHEGAITLYLSNVPGIPAVGHAK